MKYATNSEAISSGLAYLSSDPNNKMNDDFMEGLDGIMGVEDLKSFAYFEKHGAGSSGH